VGHGNGGVSFIHWMPAEFLHRLFRTHHSPLEGESARRGRKPEVAPVGGAAKASAAPHRLREPQGPPTPHRSSRRLAAWLLRLPLKGGVMRRMRRGSLCKNLAGIQRIKPNPPSCETVCVKNPKIQNRPKNYLLARQISAIPAFFYLSFRRKPESRANRARNAHIAEPDGPPLPSRDISAKEREARAFYAGFRLSPE